MNSKEVIFLNDRFTQGLIAGIIGWLPQTIFTFIMLHVFHIIKLSYFDFAAVLTFNHKPQGFLQNLVALLVAMAFLGLAGVSFSMFIKVISNQNILLKGCVYGASIWFIISSIVSIFQIKDLYPIDFSTSTINLIAGILWGIVMAWTLLFLNRKYGVKN
jgi:hypothetical protein